jgi:putative RNA 2'-phosphotransferase
MITEKENTKISKFLSLVLRHKPEAINIDLDENGWVDVDLLIEKSKLSGYDLDINALKYIVEKNNKKRFSFNSTLDKIRANQGHSLKIELGYLSQKPPEILYHGTGIKNLTSILKTGLQKRNRHHVHLSNDFETAINVGKRHGEPYVFKVLSEKMSANNFDFFLSENGVWLTENVPSIYLLTFEG